MKTKPLVSLFILLFYALQGYTQKFEIDSLSKKVLTTSGKEKILTLSEISKFYYSVNPHKGIEYGEQAIKLAESLNILPAKSMAYNCIGVNYMALTDYNTARMYFLKAYKNAVIYKDSPQIALSYSRMGLLYENLGKFDSCLLVFNKELAIDKSIKDDARTGTVYENIGTIHLNRGEFKTAITYLIEAKNIYEKINDKKKLPYVLLKLGNIYSETKDYMHAEKWFQSGIERSLAINDLQKAALGLNGIGIIYQNEGRFPEALVKFNEALARLNPVTNNNTTIAIYSNIGNVYKKEGKYKDALIFHKKAQELALQRNYQIGVATCMVNLGDTYFDLKNYVNARNCFEKALPVFISTKSKSNLLSAYEALVKVNNSLKDYEQSVKYYDLYIGIKDTMNKNELNVALDSLKVKFNTEETNKENLALVKNEAMQSRTITLQRNMIILAGILVILLIVLAFVIIRNRKKIMKAKKVLELKNADISSKAEELRIINEKLLELSKFKDSMNSFLVHDLKNPLNTIINLSPKRHTEHQIEAIQHSGKQMLNIVMNLLDINKYENKSMKLSPENISITCIINEACKDIAYLAEQKSIQLKLNYSHDFVVNVDHDIIERVLVNLFSNAIKFSANGDKIDVIVDKADNEMLKVVIKDNGEGISAEHIPIIFDKFTQVQAKNSGTTRSTGIGLTFCKFAVESHTGEIGVDSIPGKGTTFWFTLPMADSNKERLTIHPQSTSPEQSAFQLSEEEKAALIPYCNHLKKLSIYQISDVKNIVKGIEHQDSENIQNWKSRLLDAIADYNEVKYQGLINIDVDGKF
jgi:signal transduction histidine kinase